IGLIDFNNSAQKLAVNLTHGRTDAMAEIPSCLVSNAKRPLHLKRTHAFFRFCHQIDCKEPFRERKVSVVKDRAASYGKLIATSVAVILVALRDCRNALRLTARTSNTVRPAKFSKACS